MRVVNGSLVVCLSEYLPLRSVYTVSDLKIELLVPGTSAKWTPIV